MVVMQSNCGVISAKEVKYAGAELMRLEECGRLLI